MLPIAQSTLEKIALSIDATSTLMSARPQVGGASAQVLLLDVLHGDGHRQKYLVRVHSENDRNRNPDVAHHEFELLKALHGLGLPVARPILLDTSGKLHPIPYLVVSYIEGSTDFSPRNLPNFVQKSATLLARIHRIRQQGAFSLDFLLDRNIEASMWIHHQPDILDTALEEARLRAALRQWFPLTPKNEHALLHGDFWAGNLIWKDNEIVGLIDWEDAEIGDPLSDLSVCRLDMLWAFGVDAMRNFTTIYQSLMPHLSYDHLPIWDLYAALRPTHQLEQWSAGWVKYGRPDVTYESMCERHHWFVEQAFEQLTLMDNKGL